MAGSCGAGFSFNTEVLIMKTALAVILLVALGGACGCNTINGAGKDIQRGGTAVSHAARHVQSEL